MKTIIFSIFMVAGLALCVVNNSSAGEDERDWSKAGFRGLTPVAADSDGVAIPSMMKPITEKITITNGKVRTNAIACSPAVTSPPGWQSRFGAPTVGPTSDCSGLVTSDRYG